MAERGFFFFSRPKLGREAGKPLRRPPGASSSARAFTKWRRISGTFSPIEITMTLVVGDCAVVGIVLALRTNTGVQPLGASAAFLGMLLLQILALRINFLPGIAHD